MEKWIETKKDKYWRCNFCYKWYPFKEMTRTLVIYEIIGGRPVRKNKKWAELSIFKVFGVESYVCPSCFKNANKQQESYNNEIKLYRTWEVELKSKKIRKIMPELFGFYYELIGDIKKIFESKLKEEFRNKKMFESRLRKEIKKTTKKKRINKKYEVSVGPRFVFLNKNVRPALKQKYPNTPVAYIVSAYDKVYEAYTNKKNAWEKSPVFKDIPIRLYFSPGGGTEAIRIEKSKNADVYIAKIKTEKKISKRRYKWVVGKIYVSDTKGFDNFVLNHKLASAELIRKRNRYFSKISAYIGGRIISFDIKNDKLRGADRGVNNLLTLYDGKYKFYGSDTYNRIDEVRKLRSNLQHMRKYRQLKGLKGKDKRILEGDINNILYKIFKKPQPLIIEDLSNIKRNFDIRINNYKISWFPTKKVGDRLIYAANKAGTIVIFRNKFFPSTKLCKKCGSLNTIFLEGNRLQKCLDCKYVIDRDKGAAFKLKNTFDKNMPVIIKRTKKDPFVKHLYFRIQY